MTKHERIRAAFRREPVDRAPVALWRHFPVEDQTPEGLARAVVAFQRKYDFDLVKVTPTSDYMCIDWGTTSEYRGSPGGSREVTGTPIRDLGDWAKLRRLDPKEGSLARQLAAFRLLAQDLAGEVPTVQTVFSPLTTFRKLGGIRWLSDLRSQSDAVKSALEAITATTADFAVASLRAGADGVFYAVQEASALMDEAEYRRFGEPNDRRVLEAVGSSEWNVLHLHGERVLFDLVNSYPVAAVNWHDRRTFPSLRQALNMTSKGLLGGLDETATLPGGTPEQVRAEVADAVTQTGGRGLLVGAGCVIRVDTPEQNIVAAVQAVRNGA